MIKRQTEDEIITRSCGAMKDAIKRKVGEEITIIDYTQ